MLDVLERAGLPLGGFEIEHSYVAFRRLNDEATAATWSLINQRRTIISSADVAALVATGWLTEWVAALPACS
jgi:hypothetical protein